MLELRLLGRRCACRSRSPLRRLACVDYSDRLLGPVAAGEGAHLGLFLCGDVMTGRGIDQILPHPSDPRLHEDCVTSARRYVELAEEVRGPIPAPVDFTYVWGDALAELARARPDVRLVNLETSVTRSDEYWRGKGINYRMHPENVPCLAAAGIDCCALANNHVLDYGYAGLRETLATLQRPGVSFLEDFSAETVARIACSVRRIKRPRDVVVVSIHWGANWGFEVPAAHVRFAHALIGAGVDVVHGHSSHHVLPLEVFEERLVLYGCGDFVDDYEGIGGHEEFRPDLRLMYFPVVDPATGRLLSLRMIPMRMRRFQLRRASAEEACWLEATINRESARFGFRAKIGW